MRLAEGALRDGDTTIAALAAELGYASESSFSHAFQRVTGTTPGRYRRGPWASQEAVLLPHGDGGRVQRDIKRGIGRVPDHALER